MPTRVEGVHRVVAHYQRPRRVEALQLLDENVWQFYSGGWLPDQRAA